MNNDTKRINYPFLIILVSGIIAYFLLPDHLKPYWLGGMILAIIYKAIDFPIKYLFVKPKSEYHISTYENAEFAVSEQLNKVQVAVGKMNNGERLLLRFHWWILRKRWGVK